MSLWPGNLFQKTSVRQHISWKCTMPCSAWEHLSNCVRCPAKMGLRQHQRTPGGPEMAQGNRHGFLVSPERGIRLKEAWCLGQISRNLWGLSDQRGHSKYYQGKYQNIPAKDMDLRKPQNLETNLGFGKTLNWLKSPRNNGRNVKWIMIKVLSCKIRNLK